MKLPIFLDNTTSYRPLPAVKEIFRKQCGTDEASFPFQDLERLAKKQQCDLALRDQLGLTKAALYQLTSSGSKALHQMVETCYFQEIFHSGKNHILISELDRPAFEAIEGQWKMLGIEFKSIPLDADGHITQKMLQQCITPRTALVSLSWSHPLTGVVQPVEDVAKYCSAQEIFVHVDVSQVIGKLYFKMADLMVDYLTLDPKPFHGPSPLGMLITQYKGRMLTESESAFYQLEALKASIKAANFTIDEMHLEIARLRHAFETKLLQAIPEAKVLFQNIERLPSISVVAFPKVHGEYLMYLLGEEKLYASLWDDSYRSLQTTLHKMHQPSHLAASALSFSFSHGMTEEDVEEAVIRLVACYHRALPLAGGIL